MEKKTTSKQSYVYFITDGEYVKIGASNNVLKRLHDLQTSNARVLRLLDFYVSNDSYKLESELHSKYSRYRLNNEWFDILNKYVHKNHFLLDSQEVHDYFRIKQHTTTDDIARHCALIGTYRDGIEQVHEKAYLEYLRLYRFLDSFEL